MTTGKFAVISVIVATMLVGGIYPASAHPKKDGNQKKEHGADDKAMHEAMHRMMLETQEIMLETIKLVKKTAIDEEVVQSAEQLQHRLEDLIKKHKAMHDAMHGKMKDGMGGQNFRYGSPGGEHTEQMGQDAMDKRENTDDGERPDQQEKNSNSGEY